MKKLAPVFFILFMSCIKADGIFVSKKVVIDEVIEHTSLAIKNNTDKSIDLRNWKLTEVIDFITVRKSDYIIPPVTLSPGSTRIYSSNTLGFVLDRADTHVYLYDASGTLVSEIGGLRFK
ncbi:MAG TPA: lamin tail domain-containing protein [Flavitalea sp.]|nr:lamin tail domain-containing protein [Flavitalea sp.]